MLQFNRALLGVVQCSKGASWPGAGESHQDQFWKAFNLGKSSKQQTTKLIKQLFLMTWDMW